LAIRNLMTAPASDDSLVVALLEFANGADVVICGQPSPPGELSSWSRWRDTASQEERAAHAALLQQVIDGGPLPLIGHPSERRAPHPIAAVIRLPALDEPDRERMLLPNDNRGLLECLAHMDVSMDRELVLLARPHGYSLADYRRFDNVASALAYALRVLLDQGNAYCRALCRCKLPSCQRFYLARKSPKGGPPNRTYCKPEHRDEHHNSAGRKVAARKKARRAK
jgi:hypothetical protein